MTTVLFVQKSANAKTGPIPVVYAPRETCPPTCAHYRTTCYAESGPVRLAWNRADAPESIDWPTLCDRVAALPEHTLWRYAVAGDLPGVGQRVNVGELRRLIHANSGLRGFTYSHKRSRQALDAIRSANLNGFTINLSADNPADADAMIETGAGPVVTLIPADTAAVSYTPRGRRIVICPAQTRYGITCETCKLCAMPGRTTIVGRRRQRPSR